VVIFEKGCFEEIYNGEIFSKGKLEWFIDNFNLLCFLGCESMASLFPTTLTVKIVGHEIVKINGLERRKAEKQIGR